ncbi:hypothetical protein CRENBAI_026439 [Crenichthys baileyi]|uniref:Uncharacterized protein n=1 Tax=Crenichthys baileyi TaxID=28760 RepID=A0AAV9RP69_9TELE
MPCDKPHAPRSKEKACFSNPSVTTLWFSALLFQAGLMKGVSRCPLPLYSYRAAGAESRSEEASLRREKLDSHKAALNLKVQSYRCAAKLKDRRNSEKDKDLV